MIVKEKRGIRRLLTHSLQIQIIQFRFTNPCSVTQRLPGIQYPSCINLLSSLKRSLGPFHRSFFIFHLHCLLCTTYALCTLPVLLKLTYDPPAFCKFFTMSVILCTYKFQSSQLSSLCERNFPSNTKQRTSLRPER